MSELSKRGSEDDNGSQWDADTWMSPRHPGAVTQIRRRTRQMQAARRRRGAHPTRKEERQTDTPQVSWAPILLLGCQSRGSLRRRRSFSNPRMRRAKGKKPTKTKARRKFRVIDLRNDSTLKIEFVENPFRGGIQGHRDRRRPRSSEVNQG